MDIDAIGVLTRIDKLADALHSLALETNKSCLLSNAAVEKLSIALATLSAENATANANFKQALIALQDAAVANMHNVADVQNALDKHIAGQDAYTQALHEWISAANININKKHLTSSWVSILIAGVSLISSITLAILMYLRG